ncbi:MAG: hypothetical protein SA339_05140 [Methanomassiliicoccus sp.]|nr:hypothetical protein [Methanomassiliicoccus sp.]
MSSVAPELRKGSIIARLLFLFAMLWFAEFVALLLILSSLGVNL